MRGNGIQRKSLVYAARRPYDATTQRWQTLINRFEKEVRGVAPASGNADYFGWFLCQMFSVVLNTRQDRMGPGGVGCLISSPYTYIYLLRQNAAISCYCVTTLTDAH